METKSHHLVLLDQLRGVAIIAVFVFHVFCGAYGSNELGWRGWSRDFHAATGMLMMVPFALGKYGVAIFFVISGFCIHLSHAKSKTDTFGRFFSRRFWRIYPPYLFCLLVSIGLARWRTGDFGFMGGQPDFFSHLFLVHNFGRDFSGSINPPFWSIAVEVQLYALYPLLWSLARRIGWGKTLLATMVIEFSFQGVGAFYGMIRPATAAPFWVLTNPFAFWFTWCLGATVADYYLQNKIPAVSRWQALAVSLLALASYFFRPTHFLTFTLVAVATAAWICVSIRSGASARQERWYLKMLSAFGLVSYSLYLIHQPVLYLAHPLALAISPGFYHPLILVFAGLVTFFPAYAVALFLYRTIELGSVAAGKSLGRNATALVP